MMLWTGNATELFLSMDSAIDRTHMRRSDDAASPCRVETYEAQPFRTFVLTAPQFDAVACKDIDMRWAIANVLHFFAATEEADVLRKYNKHASRFLTGTRWIGAYGAIAMPQIQECVTLLMESPDTRRAVASMGGPVPQDANRPACWSHLHFLRSRGKLHLHVYQRSLNLYGVMPYDVTVLTNVLAYVASMVRAPIGYLYWTVGSLHVKRGDSYSGGTGRRLESWQIPIQLLMQPDMCMAMLETPDDSPVGRALRGHPS
jgi:hypothetical protein